MSNTTREINRITTAIISISVKLIVYALIILLLYEAVTRGYAFGHEVFYAEAMDEKPGRDLAVNMAPDTSVSEAARILADKGVIKSEFAFIFQSKFYDYDTVYPGMYDLNTSMTSKEILQALNVKPEGWEEDESTEQASGNRLKTTDESSAQPASAQPAQAAETGAAGQAAPGAEEGTQGAAAAESGEGSQGAAAAAAESGEGSQGAAAAESGEGSQGAAAAAAAAESGEGTQGAAAAAAESGEGSQGAAQPSEFSEDEDDAGGWIQDVPEGAGQ